MSECLCGDADCVHVQVGYPWCRSCASHHRPPECAVDQEGFALAQCGCRWVNIDADPSDHRPGCYSEEPEPDGERGTRGARGVLDR